MRWRAARPPRPFKEGSRYLQGRFKEGSRDDPKSRTPTLLPPPLGRPLHTDRFTARPTARGSRRRPHRALVHTHAPHTHVKGRREAVASISTRSRSRRDLDPTSPTPPPRPARNLPTISRRTRGANSWNAPPLLARSRPRPREITARDCDLGLARLRLRLTPRLTPRACP